MRPEVKGWLTQSEADFKAASSAIETGNFFVTAFYSHQSVEKILKAAIIYTKRKLQPKTHNLIELGKELELPEDIMHKLRILNPEYTVSRYPDAANGIPLENYDKTRAEELLKLSGEVILWVNSVLIKKD
jgi:HEPN domain-containing protein